MNDRDDELRQAVALFRYGLIADLVHLPPGTAGIRQRLREKAERTYTIPGTRRTGVAAETMRDWLSVYRTGGFEALYPKSRADRGQPRRLSPEVAERLIELKTEHPSLSVNELIKTARSGGIDHRLAPSTVHRLLSREGLLDRRPGEPTATDRRRFAFRDAGELWMSDVMHGPKAGDGRRRRKTFLIAFLDDATRVIPFAAFAFSENTTAFLPVFKNALIRRGLPLDTLACTSTTVRTTGPNSSPWCVPSSASRSSMPAPTSPLGREKSKGFSEPCAPLGSATSGTKTPRASRRSTEASGRGSRASTTTLPIVASTRAPPSSNGRSPATACATPTPPSTSTTCSCSRPNDAS